MSAQFGQVTGKVTSITLIDPDGLNIGLSKVMDWQFKPDVREVDSTGLDGVREILPAYNGGSGSFTAELRDNSLYEFFQARQAEYKTLGTYRYSTFYGYINYINPTGSLVEETHQFINSSLVLESGGDFRNEETVKMKITFKCQDWQTM